jgi:hypothetical protein
MNAPRPRRESMSLEEATVSNTWEIAATVEVLELRNREPCSENSISVTTVGVFCALLMEIMMSTN